MLKIELIALLIARLTVGLASDDNNYWTARETFIKHEESQMLGSSIVLNEKEKIANEVLMGHKMREYDAGFENPDGFAPARHFFLAKEDIERSQVFQFIRKLPKGAALHGHDLALTSNEYIYNLTFKDNLYACTVNERLRMKFLKHPSQDTSCNWSLMSKLREIDDDYDEWVKGQLTLFAEDPVRKYGDINTVWKAFIDIFRTVDDLVFYKPVLQEYTYQALRELHEDNVMYLEFRGTLAPVYDLDGTNYGPADILGFYREAIEQFKYHHPDFVGARFIYAPSRHVTNSTATNYIEIVEELKEKHPAVLAGFDLVGQEDLGKPLTDFISQLQNISSKGIDFFFHAGETDWYGTGSDLNLVDAILLGTKRIGHGYGLSKHPLVLEAIKERDIAIEVCPLSNQVLMLVKDVRNHPAASLIANGFPVVISYDDPSYWGAKGLSYDFYMAFMGMASRNADLRLLKQLAKNSIKYSSLAGQEKEDAIVAWNQKWDKFIDSVVSEAELVYKHKVHHNSDEISVIHI